MTKLYFDLVGRWYNPDAPVIPKTLARKIPSIISSQGSGLIGADEGNKTLNLPRGKNIIDFLDSPSCAEVRFSYLAWLDCNTKHETLLQTLETGEKRKDTCMIISKRVLSNEVTDLDGFAWLILFNPSLIFSLSIKLLE